MRWGDRKPRRNLRDLPVPPHRPGFWEAVEEELSQSHAAPRSHAAEGPGDIVELRQPQPGGRSVSPWLVASAAAAVVVLVLGGATAILTRPAADPDAVATPDTSIDAALEADSLSGDAATTVAQVVEPAPWAGAQLSDAEAPEVLAAAWEGAENQRWCAALAPSNAGSLADNATVREAEFPGGWGLAWDRNEGPGQDPDATDCLDCGRSAFGVAGTGTPHRPGTGENRNAAITWSDGSFANIDDGAAAGDPSLTKLTALIVVEGQGCRYEVWSNLGEAHLRKLLGSLRFVEGMTPPPVVLRTPSDEPTVMTYGAAPWIEGEPVDAAALDPVLLGKWGELGITAPQLVLTDLGDDLEGAEIRTWGSGVAWDKPNEPGHDNQNLPCAACGRGVAGIGWEPVSEDVPMAVPLPYRIEWEDGSYAEYGGRLADASLPRDRVLFFDPETGEETIDALQAIVHLPGSDVEVVVWSHLGEAHLRYLLAQLRMADVSE